MKKTSCESKWCLLTNELSELLIEVNTTAFHFCTFDHLELLFLISESILRIAFPEKNGILYTQSKSEILENIIKIGC